MRASSARRRGGSTGGVTLKTASGSAFVHATDHAGVVGEEDFEGDVCFAVVEHDDRQRPVGDADGYGGAGAR
jgi:hypothetical protein